MRGWTPTPARAMVPISQTSGGSSESVAVQEHYSRLALVSVLCSSCICLPPVVALGPILSLWALFDIRRHPGKRGTSLAIGALVGGTALTVGYVLGAVWWNSNVREPMLRGPQAALRAAAVGELDGFRSEFLGDGASASDQEVQRFVDELRGRYGNFIASEQARVQPAAAALSSDSMKPQIPYELRFERRTVPAIAEFILMEQGHRGLIGKFGWLRVQDSELGDIFFPESARTTIAADSNADEGNSDGD